MASSDPTITADGATLAIPTPGATLLEVLRGSGHEAPKGACRRGECGACTVLVGDAAVMSCTMLAALVTEPVTTAAGLIDADDLRQAFADRLGFQCGFCTPGQVVRAEAVLRENPARTRAEIVSAMAGNICRCTGYRQIVDAVCDVAAQRCATAAASGCPALSDEVER